MVKKVIQIALLVVIALLVYVLLQQIMTPMHFQKEQKKREEAVIERLYNIRLAQRAYKQKYLQYTPSFDVLINFILNDSLVFRKSIGSADDSVAVAKGQVKTEEFYKMAADTVFGSKKLTVEQIKELPLIPYGDGKKFIMDAGFFKTESEIVVPVFECKAPFKDFLGDLDEQELINLIDIHKKTLHKYPGLKVGALDQATNDAGNWE